MPTVLLNKLEFDKEDIGMDFLFELLLELILEGTVELSKSIKVPKYIRYLLIGLIVLFFIAVIGIVLIAGFVSLEQNLLQGFLIIALAIFLLIMSIVKFKKTYLTRRNRQ